MDPALFFTISLLSLLLGCFVLSAWPAFFLQSTAGVGSQWWILLMVFGFAQPAVFCSVYAALPSVFGLTLYSRQMVYLHCGVHLAGLVVVLLVPFAPELPQAPMGGFLMACGAGLFIANVGLSLRKMARPDGASAFLSLGCLWLAVTALLGLPFAARSPLPLLTGSNWIAGWLFLTIAGVCFNVLYALGYRQLCCSARTFVVWCSLSIANFGIAWVAASMTVGPPAFLLLTAILFFVGTMVARSAYVALRRDRKTEDARGAGALSLGLSMIPIIAVLLIFAAAQQIGAHSSAALPAVESGGEQPALFVTNALDRAVGMAALWGVVVPGLLGAFFALRTKVRVSGAFAVGYITGAALVVCGVALSEKFPIAVGASLLALGSSGAFAAFVGSRPGGLGGE